MLKRFFFYILLISIILSPYRSKAEIVKYNPSVFIDDSDWITSFNFYEMALLTKVSENELTIDLGKRHGIQYGLIYDIYHDNPSKPVAKIVIAFMDRYSARGNFLKKPEFVDSIVPGDKAIFTGLIETELNLSYQNRIENEITGKITLIEDNLCFININKSQGVLLGQIYTVYNPDGLKSGKIEIVNTVDNGDSIGTIKEKKRNFETGYIVKKEKRTSNEWLDIARNLASNNYIDDALYAYFKALKIKKISQNVHTEIGTLVLSFTKNIEKEGDIGRSLYYWKKCKNFNSMCEENYNFLVKKTTAQSKFLWDKKSWLETIKILENLPKTENTQKYLSAGYNFLGKEVEDKNSKLATYCYEQSIAASSKNVFAIKNLINIYFQNILFKKAFLWVKKLKQVAIREDDKNWADIKQEEITRFNRNIPPNYSFSSYFGKEYVLDSLRGNVILLVLWNLDNASSKSEIDYLKFFYKNYKDKNFKILAIHKIRNSEIVKMYLNESGKTDFDIVFANDDMSFLFPDLKALPQNVIIDKKGQVIYKKTGFNENEIKNLVDGLLLE